MEKTKNKQLNIGYDRESDVLDIAIGHSKPAITVEVGDDVFVRVNEKTKEVLGFMILNFQKQFQPKHKTSTKIPVAGTFELVKN